MLGVLFLLTLIKYNQMEISDISLSEENPAQTVSHRCVILISNLN